MSAGCKALALVLLREPFRRHTTSGTFGIKGVISDRQGDYVDDPFATLFSEPIDFVVID